LRRHRFGDSPQNQGRRALGFAAECLAKEILASAGITIDRPSGFKEHFPNLGTKIRLGGHTRVMSLLMPIVQTATFLDGWQAECRYETDIPTRDAETRFNSWCADVDSLFSTAGVP
jgi:hypothetical protein